MGAGRSIVSFVGRCRLTESVVKNYWKGMTVVRALTHKIKQVQTDWKANMRAILNQCANAWKHELTKYERDGWELYASLIKSAINREKEDVARGSKNVIRQRAKLESGYNAFVEGNGLAKSAGFLEKDADGKYILAKNSPVGTPFPPPPLDLTAVYDPMTFSVTVTWTDPKIQGSPLKSAIRIWAVMQNYRKIHPQIVGVVPLGVKTFTFNIMHTREAVDNPYQSFEHLKGGLLRIQLETVVQQSAGVGAVAGAPSAVRELLIPLS